MEGYNPRTLISLVQDNPILYDLYHPAYMNHYRKKKVWENIARNFYPGWDHMSPSQQDSAVDTFKNKWRHMRDNYRRELRLQTEGRSGAAGASHRREYIYFQELDFLRPGTEMCSSESSLDVSEDNTENAEKIPYVTIKTEIIEPMEFINTPEICHQSPVSETSVAVEPSNAATIAPKRSLGSECGGSQPARKRYRSHSDLLQEWGQALQDALKILSMKDKFKESPFYHFSMFVCDMMEKVPPEKVLGLKIKILQLINDATIEAQAPTLPQEGFFSIC